MILALGHNDLDQLGCQLCIHEKFNSKSEISYYNTNYKNLDSLCHDIEDRLNHNREDIKLLMITDISFAERKRELLSLRETLKKKNIPCIFVDHHLYPDDFFEELETDLFKIYWDTEKCGALGTYNALKLENPKLLMLIKLIDIFDLWKEEHNLFELANDLNNYFWNAGRMQIAEKFLKAGYSLPYDFKNITQKCRDDAIQFYNRLKEKKLIFHTTSDISCGLLDDYFNFVVENELKHKKVFICASSFGVIRFRFSKDGYSDEHVIKIKDILLDGKTRGHLRSFSIDADTKTSQAIIEKFKYINNIIEEITK